MFLHKWYAPLAFIPLVIVLLVDFGPLHSSSRPGILKWGLASLLWAAAVVGYAFYLAASFRCPACHARYGLGNSCRSCELPRHNASQRRER